MGGLERRRPRGRFSGRATRLGAAILVACACALPWLWVLLGSYRTVVEVVGSGTDKVLFCAEMEEGEEFTLSFVHSVNRRPVHDTLRVARDHLVVVRSKYDSFGAGMPESSGAEGHLSWDDDGWMVWTVNRPIPALDLFVGREAMHSVSIRGVEKALAELVEPGTSISIRTTSRSRVERWKRSCLK